MERKSIGVERLIQIAEGGRYLLARSQDNMLDSGLVEVEAIVEVGSVPRPLQRLYTDDTRSEVAANWVKFKYVHQPDSGSTIPADMFADCITSY